MIPSSWFAKASSIKTCSASASAIYWSLWAFKVTSCVAAKSIKAWAFKLLALDRLSWRLIMDMLALSSNVCVAVWATAASNMSWFNPCISDSSFIISAFNVSILSKWASISSCSSSLCIVDVDIPAIAAVIRDKEFDTLSLVPA